MQLYLHDCPLALCPVLEEKKTKKKTEVRIRGKLGRTEGTSFIFEAAQRRALTELEEAAEEQQQQRQVGGSGVHAEWWCFTAVRLKYKGMRRPEEQSDGRGRDAGSERWSVQRRNSWCCWWRGGVVVLSNQLVVLLARQEMSVTSSGINQRLRF